MKKTGIISDDEYYTESQNNAACEGMFVAIWRNAIQKEYYVPHCLEKDIHDAGIPADTRMFIQNIANCSVHKSTCVLSKIINIQDNRAIQSKKLMNYCTKMSCFLIAHRVTSSSQIKAVTAKTAMSTPRWVQDGNIMSTPIKTRKAT